jgi:hypothetical protein
MLSTLDTTVIAVLCPFQGCDCMLTFEDLSAAGVDWMLFSNIKTSPRPQLMSSGGETGMPFRTVYAT